MNLLHEALASSTVPPVSAVWDNDQLNQTRLELLVLFSQNTAPELGISLNRIEVLAMAVAHLLPPACCTSDQIHELETMADTLIEAISKANQMNPIDQSILQGIKNATIGERGDF